jgi:uncharacterized protein (DUF362 family)
MDKYPVLLKEVIGYDYVKIREAIVAGMKELNAHPAGRVFVKPNIIFAHKRYGTTGYTNRVLMRALLEELSERKEVEKIILGEHCAVTVPTRYAVSEAGYNEFKKIPKVKFCYIEEAPKIFLKMTKATIHTPTLAIAKEMYDADYKIWAPKLKHHASTKITCALKLNMGIVDSRTRLKGHDWRLEEKIADLYEAGRPDLVVCDAIAIGEQAELVAKLKQINCLMMGTNGIAVDSVGARIMGFSSDEIEHLKIARSRGWEPVSDEQIEVKGDLTIEQLRERVGVLDRTFSDPRKVDTPIRFYIGEKAKNGVVCRTGCQNMIDTALAILEAYDPGALKRAKPVACVIGEYEGDVDGKGYPILLVGSCAKIKGKKNGWSIRIPGCPLIVPFFITPASFFFGLKNPYNDLSALLPFPYFFMVSYIMKCLSWFKTQYYKISPA